MAIEQLKFKIELYSTHWFKLPIAEIQLNGKSYFNGEIESTKKHPTLIEFTHDLELDKTHELTIIRSGKENRQTILKDGKIIKDQLLHIKYIEIDEIDLGALVYDGVYTPNYPEQWVSQQRLLGNILPKTIKNATSLGHNGTWTFSFTSPFYMWLLENLY